MTTAKISIATIALGALLLTAAAHAHDTPAKPAKPSKPAKPALECTLQTLEAPAGGRLEVTGKRFGKSPLVRIAGKVARLIDRYDDTIAAQIPKKSQGGEVSVHASGEKAVCGKLTILGKN